MTELHWFVYKPVVVGLFWCAILGFCRPGIGKFESNLRQKNAAQKNKTHHLYFLYLFFGPAFFCLILLNSEFV